MNTIRTTSRWFRNYGAMQSKDFFIDITLFTDIN
jgi:hypothetical protein